MENAQSFSTEQHVELQVTPPTMTSEQEEVLSNPTVLTIFLNLLDGVSTVDQIVRRTGLKPIEVSVYLDRLKKVGLVGQSNVVPISGKMMQVVYQVLEPNLDISTAVSSLSIASQMDLLFNKVKKDIDRLELSGRLVSNSKIKYAQIKVRAGAFEKFKEKIADLEAFLQEQEQSDGEETVTLMLINYQSDSIE